jgi:hypothetical protein
MIAKGMWARRFVVALSLVRAETMKQPVEERKLLVTREVVEASSVLRSAVVSTDALAAGLKVLALL